MIGNTYNSLTVLEGPIKNGHHLYYRCECKCGNTKLIEKSNITSGRNKTCGCGRSKYGGASQNGNRLFNIWEVMKKRCEKPSNRAFVKYGGIGILVCDDWSNDYYKFKDWSLSNGYDDNLSIDRIDNTKGYSPENCRWATSTQQNNNKFNNRLITYDGITQTVSQWSRALDIPRHRIDICMSKFGEHNFDKFVEAKFDTADIKALIYGANSSQERKTI